MSRDGWSTRFLNILIKRLKRTLDLCRKSYPDVDELKDEYNKCEELKYQIKERGISEEDYDDEFADIELYSGLIEREIKNIKDAEALSILEKIVKVGDRLLELAGFPAFLSSLLDVIRGAKQAKLRFSNDDDEDDDYYVN